MLRLESNIKPCKIFGKTANHITVDVQYIKPNELCKVQMVVAEAQGGNPLYNQSETMPTEDYQKWTDDDNYPMDWAIQYLKGVGIKINLIEAKEDDSDNTAQ